MSFNKTPFRVLGLKDEIRKIRIDIPLSYMGLENLVVSHEAVAIDRTDTPGVFIFHRQNMHTLERLGFIDELAKRGWVVVMDFDDDPRVFRAHVESDFVSFKAVHAVTVSTPRLAELIKRWNPYVQVLPNAVDDKIFKLRESESFSQKLNIIFAAYNRTEDIEPLQSSIIKLQENYGEQLNWTIVFDEFIPQLLAGQYNVTPYGRVAYEEYIKLLQDAHIALLPLRPTVFNSMKSDLKFIECCATGVVPVCSKTVYGETDPSGRIGIFPTENSDWYSSIANLLEDRSSLYPRVLNGYQYVHNARLASGQSEFRTKFYSHLLENQAFLEKERINRLS